MPRTPHHEHLVQLALPESGHISITDIVAGQDISRRLRVARVNLDDHDLIQLTSTPRPAWIKERPNPYHLPEIRGGFTPADLVLAIPAPAADKGPTEHHNEPTPDAKWDGDQKPDMSRFNHLNDPERFGRHLVLLHEQIPSSKIITMGEILRGKKRKFGQVFVSNLYGYYEVEGWYDDKTRKTQVEWTRWLLGALEADARKGSIPRCPGGARDVLKVAVANLLSRNRPKQWSHRVMEGTRLEVGVRQVEGLMKIGRACCIRKLTVDGENAKFEDDGMRVERLPKPTSEDFLDRLVPWVIHGRIGEAFQDAQVIATAIRKKETKWEHLREQSKQAYPTLEQLLSSSTTVQHAPRRPSGLRHSILPQASEGQTLAGKAKRPRKVDPYWTAHRLRGLFGNDIDEAIDRVPFPNLAAVINETKVIRTERAVAVAPAGPPQSSPPAAAAAGEGQSTQDQDPAEVADEEQARANSATSDAILITDARRGTKRPLSDISSAPGSAQEAIKRARIENERRRSSPVSSPAQAAIRDARAANRRPGSPQMVSSSPVPRPQSRAAVQQAKMAHSHEARPAFDPGQSQIAEWMAPPIPSPTLAQRPAPAPPQPSPADLAAQIISQTPTHSRAEQQVNREQQLLVARHELESAHLQVQDLRQPDSEDERRNNRFLRAPGREYVQQATQPQMNTSQVPRPQSREMAQVFRGNVPVDQQQARRNPGMVNAGSSMGLGSRTQVPSQPPRQARFPALRSSLIPPVRQPLRQSRGRTLAQAHIQPPNHPHQQDTGQRRYPGEPPIQTEDSRMQDMQSTGASGQWEREELLERSQVLQSVTPAPAVGPNHRPLPQIVADTAGPRHHLAEDRYPVPRDNAPQFPFPEQAVIDFSTVIQLDPKAPQRLHAEERVHVDTLVQLMNAQYRLIDESLRHAPQWAHQTPQERDRWVHHMLQEQFRGTEAGLQARFPQLSITDLQENSDLLQRQLYSLGRVLSIANPPPAGSSPGFVRWHWDCCHLEARDRQLLIVRIWVRHWQQTLAELQSLARVG